MPPKKNGRRDWANKLNEKKAADAAASSAASKRPAQEEDEPFVLVEDGNASSEDEDGLEIGAADPDLMDEERAGGASERRRQSKVYCVLYTKRTARWRTSKA